MAHSPVATAPAPAPHAAPAAPAAPAPQAGTLRLPTLVFGVVEVRRLKRELEALEQYMAQASIREPGTQPTLPRVSRLLDALAADNHLNLLQPDDRKAVKAFLVHTEQHAPVIHMSFATDPSSAFTAKIVTWLRASISPDVLLEVGLQPNIAAGAILRTTNKLFDLSLRERFSDSQKLLIESLEKEADIAPVASQAASAPHLQNGLTPTVPAGSSVSEASAGQAPQPAAAPQAATASTAVPQAGVAARGAAPAQPQAATAPAGGVPQSGTPAQPGAAAMGKPAEQGANAQGAAA